MKWPSARLNRPGLNTSGKSRIFLIALKDAYHNLTTVLSNIKSEVAKPDCAWNKSSLPMNLTYLRLIVRLRLSADLSNILSHAKWSLSSGEKQSRDAGQKWKESSK